MNEVLEAIATISLSYKTSPSHDADSVIVEVNADSTRITDSFTPSLSAASRANLPYTAFYEKPCHPTPSHHEWNGIHSFCREITSTCI
jgi:hypothetical protein